MPRWPTFPNYVGPNTDKTVSDQSNVYTYSLKVAWSGMSLIYTSFTI